MTKEGPATKNPLPLFGGCKGMLIINAEDDSHLDDFADYMPPESSKNQPRKAGSAKGLIQMADDFDAPFEDYSDDIP